MGDEHLICNISIVLIQILQMSVICTHLKLLITVARHNFKKLKKFFDNFPSKHKHLYNICTMLDQRL